MSNFDLIVHSSDPVTLVGGGQATTVDLQKALTQAPLCVAADGGAALALSAGVSLTAVIGDFDSLPAQVLSQIPTERQYHVSEQESTDFEKALSRIAAPLVIGVGFLGGRIDHQLAALHVLAMLPSRPCILVGEQEILFLAPPDMLLPTQKGDVVSLFPLGQTAGRSEGLKWPINGLAFSAVSRIGTSNQALGPVSLQIDSPDMIVILPRSRLTALVQRFLTPACAKWPSREE